MPVLLPSQPTGEVTPGPLRRPPPRLAPLPRAYAPSSSGPRRGALRAGRLARAVLGRTFAAPYTPRAVLTGRPALRGRATRPRPMADPRTPSRAPPSKARPLRERSRAESARQSVDVVRAAVAAPVDEERGRAGHAAQSAPSTSWAIRSPQRALAGPR